VLTLTLGASRHLRYTTAPKKTIWGLGNPVEDNNSVTTIFRMPHTSRLVSMPLVD
jgi:hypothetical protein